MHPKKADNLRKIIKGKKPKEFKSYKKTFIKGAIEKWKGERGIATIAEEVWEKFSEAGSYLFPRGHAASYALLGYICQYLKVNYPVEFFTCHLRHQPQNKYGKVRNIAMNKYGLKFTMPNVRAPIVQFECKGGTILWPVSAIKSVGSKAADTIVKNAPYDDMEDFYNRIDRRACNTRVVGNLIIAGAFKDFGTKKAMIKEYRRLKGKKEQERPMPVAFESKEAMYMEMAELYGFELKTMRSLYKKQIKMYSPINTYEEFLAASHGSRVRCFGKVMSHIVKDTAKGNTMSYVRIKDGDDVIKITLFPESHDLMEDRIAVGDVVVVAGQKNIWTEEHSLIMPVDTYSKPHTLRSGFWLEVM
jgi:DNA polymerase III subunit alpha